MANLTTGQGMARADLNGLFRALRILIVFALALATPTLGQNNPLAGMAWDKSHAGTPLDLSGYALVFNDDFTTKALANSDGSGGPPGFKWYTAVTGSVAPWSFAEANGAYSFVYSVGPEPGADGNALRIEARRLSTDPERWVTGRIQTYNLKGQGFSGIQNGYIECRAKFEEKHGAWHACWAETNNVYPFATSTTPYAEIDIIEWYGAADPKGHHHAVHVHDAKHPQPGESGDYFVGDYTGMADAKLGDTWHTHGLLLTPTLIIIYLDRSEVARFPRYAASQRPFFPIFTLQINTRAGNEARTSPIYAWLDHVLVWQPSSSR